MKILHTADWHIGKSRNLKNYLTRQKFMLKSILNLVEKHEVDILINSGDLFDNARDIQEEERALLVKYLGKLDTLCKVFLISGQHDLLTKEQTCLQFLKKLQETEKFKNTYLSETEPEVINLKNISVINVPFKEWKGKDFKRTIKKLSIKATNKLIIVNAHVKIQNAKVTDKSNWKMEGVTFPKLDKIFYFAFGDNHLYQKISDNAYFCGCPIQHKFDDSLRTGVILIDTEKENKKFIEIEHEKIPKLIELTKLPETKEEKEIFKNNLISLKVPEGVIANKESLPDNVQKIEEIIQEKEKIDIDTKDEELLEGLTEMLAEKGLQNKDQEICVNIIKKLIKNIRN